MKVEIDKSDMLKVNIMLAGLEDSTAQITVKAINGALIPTRGRATKLISKVLNLKPKRIREDFKPIRANKFNQTGYLIAKGRPVGLLNFLKLNQRKPYSAYQHRTGGLQAGVLQTKVMKGKPWAKFPHAFVAKTTKINPEGKKSTTTQMFQRKKMGWSRSGTGVKHAGYFASLSNKHRYKVPAWRMSGPRIEDIYSRPSIINDVEDFAGDVMILKADKAMIKILGKLNNA